MKKLISLIMLLALGYFCYNNRENLVKLYNYYFVPIEDKITKLEKNAYYRDENFKYVQNTSNFIPKQNDEILNIFYTIVNSGMTDFTFYCPNEYDNCLNDVSDIANNQNTISNLNNFVHPYNSFKTLQTEIESSGKITVHIEKVYTEKNIILINHQVDEILQKQINASDTMKNKIKKIHDYIINHTTYDKERSDKKISNYESDNAYGVLFQNYGLCGGYTDTMMLFLEKFNLPNYKIATENHIWNVVNLDNQWLHLDLTWDDPVTSDGKDVLEDTFFLINDNELKKLENNDHNYNHEIYEQ